MSDDLAVGRKESDNAEARQESEDLAAARKEIEDLRISIKEKNEFVQRQDWGNDTAAKLSVMNKIKPIADKLQEKEKEFKEKYPNETI